MATTLDTLFEDYSGLLAMAGSESCAAIRVDRIHARSDVAGLGTRGGRLIDETDDIATQQPVTPGRQWRGTRPS